MVSCSRLWLEASMSNLPLSSTMSNLKSLTLELPLGVIQLFSIWAITPLRYLMADW